MPRTKKEKTPPPALDRSIKCAFCQKELDPQKDEITFIGMGKWRDGPGLFHAVCSARTPENEDNPCLQSGVAWATKFAKNEPVLFTYEQWKARPIRRKLMAIRSAKGLKDDDNKHNEQAMKRNFGEMKLALEMMAKHSIKPSGGEQFS